MENSKHQKSKNRFFPNRQISAVSELQEPAMCLLPQAMLPYTHIPFKSGFKPLSIPSSLSRIQTMVEKVVLSSIDSSSFLTPGLLIVIVSQLRLGFLILGEDDGREAQKCLLNTWMSCQQEYCLWNYSVLYLPHPLKNLPLKRVDTSIGLGFRSVGL